MPVPWSQFVAEQPAFAAKVRARFEAHRHHILGTIRTDGAPRLSGTEVQFVDDRLTLGMMPDSLKLADVHRDPRVEIHSAPLEVEALTEGDARVSGVLVDTEPTGEVEGAYFALLLDRATLIQVDGDELQVTTWRPGTPLVVTRRK